MRTILILVSALVLILLGVWATLVIYFDEARLKALAIEQVREQTGRELHLDGPLDLKVFPRLSLDAREVRLSGPPGYDGPDLFEAERLAVSVRLLPLLRGRVETGEITLDRAELNIHTDRAGRSSLDDLVGEPAEPAEPAAAPALTTEAIRLRNVSVIVSDAVTGASERYLVELLEIDRFAFDTPVPFRFEGNLGDPPMFERLSAEGRMRVPAGAGPVELSPFSLEGRLSGMDLGLTGRLYLDAGPPLDAGLSDGRLRLDGDAFDLSFAYTDPGRPRVSAELSGERLDADALLARFEAEEASEEEGGQPLLIFRDTDLDAGLSLQRLIISGLELSGVEARARARNGVLTVEPLSGALAGGRLDASARIDLNREPVEVVLSPRFELTSLSEALSPWGLDRWLAGAGSLELDLSGRGLEPGELLKSLTGSGRYDFRDGRIKGLNLDGMIQALQARDIARAASAGVGGETVFREMQGMLRIDQGRLVLPDLAMATERLGIEGDVVLGLTDLALDGVLRLSGDRLDSIPLTLDGSLTEPVLRPDLARAAEEQIREEAGRRLQDLLGRGRQREPETEDNG